MQSFSAYPLFLCNSLKKKITHETGIKSSFIKLYSMFSTFVLNIQYIRPQYWVH